MSLILAIETGADVCSVGIAKTANCCRCASDEGRDHARKVGVFVDELLRETGIVPDELDAVAVGKGPGSYTGLRISVSFARDCATACKNRWWPWGRWTRWPRWPVRIMRWDSRGRRLGQSLPLPGSMATPGAWRSMRRSSMPGVSAERGFGRGGRRGSFAAFRGQDVRS